MDQATAGLAPIVLESIAGSRRRLRFRAGPQAFAVDLDEEGQLLVVRDDELDIHAYGQTRAEVVADLVEQLEMMWLEYAEADEAHLTPGAAALGRILRQRLAVHNDDA